MSAEGHAALMDGVYRHQRYIYDFTRKYYLFGRDTLIRELPLQAGQNLVEIGCGTGRNLILMARRFPEAHFFGLDASQEMLKTAETAIARAGLGARISLAHGYAEEISPSMFGANGFNHAVFSYSLSMIPQWKQALSAASSVLSAGGQIHAVDFGDLRGLGGAGARAMRAWLALFHVTPRSDIVAKLEVSKILNQKGYIDLKLLPGRYAFVLHCDRDALENMLV